MNILTKGERRYEIIEITQEEPHVAALVKLLDEPVGEGFTGITAELTEEYTKLIQRPDHPERRLYVRGHDSLKTRWNCPT